MKKAKNKILCLLVTVFYCSFKIIAMQSDSHYLQGNAQRAAQLAFDRFSQNPLAVADFAGKLEMETLTRQIDLRNNLGIQTSYTPGEISSQVKRAIAAAHCSQKNNK